MPQHERRQHFRIEDQIYFEYKVLEPGNCYTDQLISQDLLGQGGQRYQETMHYFKNLDQELSALTETLAARDPAIAQYLNLINTKIDFLVRKLTMDTRTQLRKVNLSLGGMSFHTKEKIKEKSYLKLVIYTKPKMVPIIINAVAVYCEYLSQSSYRTAVQFENMTSEQEQLLSQHIMHAQVQYQTDS